MNNTKVVRARIAEAFVKSTHQSAVASEIAFHMTDWDHNIDDLLKIYNEPQRVTNDEIVQIVLEFLAHVPNHVAAAKKLAGLGPIEDVFEVGVLVEDE